MATPRNERTSAPAGAGSGTGNNDCDNGPSTISASAGATPRNSGSSTGSGSTGPAGSCIIATNSSTSSAANCSSGGTPGSGTENGSATISSSSDKGVTPGAPGSSGHKGSIRGNKLARRARSFKDDFLEKISQIRTPTSTMTRSHSPNSPRPGSAGSGNRSSGGSSAGRPGGHHTDDPLTSGGRPVQDLTYHVRQVKNALTHFKDVILKNKLEMLPGNGTVVLELIANVHTALQSYTLNENSSVLINATNHVYMSLGNLLKLCDEVLLTADNENCPSLSKENVKEIVERVENAVNNLVNLANEKISDKAAGSTTAGHAGNTSSNTLQRPAVDIAGQRTSLPDIPLTPRERDILEQTSRKTVRASHSTDSIIHDSSPPPKPPLPDRAQEPPPLPPKRKGNHAKNHSFHETSDSNSDAAFLGCVGLDVISLRSRSPEESSSLLSASAGSLDSALNHSREEEELRALAHDKSSNQILGLTGVNSSNIWDESDCSGMLLHSGAANLLSDSTLMNNRNSNESGFASMYSLRMTRDHQTSSSYKTSYTTNCTTTSQVHKSESILDGFMANNSSGKVVSLQTANSQHHANHHQQQHQQQQQLQKIDTLIAQPTGEGADIVLTSSTTTEFISSRMESASLSKVIQYGSIEANDDVFGNDTSGGEDKPPALPVKTRSHSIRRERHPSQYDNVDEAEHEKGSHDTFNCSMHTPGGFHGRQHMFNNLPSKHISLIEPRRNAFNEEPPPLPMKKKHIMAYMEIFGSATQNHSEYMRHSMHTYNLSHHTGEQHHHHHQHHQQHTISMTSGGSSLTHSQTMSLSPSRVTAPPPISPPSSPGLNVKPPALPPKKQRNTNSKTPSVTSTPPASPKVFGSCEQPSSPSQHHNSCSSPSPSSSSIGTLLPTPPPKSHHHSILLSAEPTGTSTPTGNQSSSPVGTGSEGPSLVPSITKIKVSPVSGEEQLHASNSSTAASNTSSSATTSTTTPTTATTSTSPNSQCNNLNNLNRNTSSLYSLVSNSIVVARAPEEDYLHLCDTTTTMNQQPHSQHHHHHPHHHHHQPHHSRLSADAAGGTSSTPTTTTSTTGTNLNSPSNSSNLLVNTSNSNNSSSPPADSTALASATNPKEQDDVTVVLRRKQSLNLIEELDISNHLVFKKENEDGPDVKGGHPDALIIHATKVQKISDAYGEAFITTFRTFITPLELIQKLTYRYSLFHCQMIDAKQKAAKESFSLLVRVVNDLTCPDLTLDLLGILMEFVYQLVCAGHLTMAKLLRAKLIEKVILYKQRIPREPSALAPSQRMVMVSPPTLLDLKSAEIAEQMTLLDAELFHKIEIPEVLIWAQEQNEERSPNLTTFTEHFNKMSYWARSQILTQYDAKDREKHVNKFIKIMKHLRKINNYNSYLALLSALDSAPIQRLEWHRTITEGLKEYCALIDSSSSFRAYRQALADTNPPCIPYIGLVLQDLTFVHIGNPDLLPDGSINFSKRWQQYHIVVNMKRFKKGSYQFKKNEKIIGFFDNFDNYLDEDAMWHISESIKPRGGRKTNTTSN